MKKFLVLVTLFIFKKTTAQLENKNNNLCKKIEMSIDDFTNDTTFKTPISFKLYVKKTPIQMLKVKQNTKVHYFLYLETKGSTLNIGEKGVSIIFDDGEKFIKLDEEIKVEVDYGEHWSYRAFIPLNKTEAEIFANKKIVKYRLYIYDEIIESKAAENFTKFVNCLIVK